MTAADIRATVAMFAIVAADGRWVGTEGGFDQDSRAAMYAASLAEPAVHRFLVAVARDGEIVGSAHTQVASYGVADIAMAIARDWRGLGVGGRMLDALIAEARDLGAHKLSLQVWPHNLPRHPPLRVARVRSGGTSWCATTGAGRRASCGTRSS